MHREEWKDRVQNTNIGGFSSTVIGSFKICTSSLGWWLGWAVIPCTKRLWF